MAKINAGLIAPDFAAIEKAGLPGMGVCWCAWKLVQRESGKPSKVPYGRSGALSTQKPESWLAYADAKAMYEVGGFAGIGYLNQPDDGVVCLDADGVLDTDGTVLDSGREIVAQLEALGCYLERSPSGRGIRGFIKGVKGGGSKARTLIDEHSVEAYQTSGDAGGEAGQYVTITGAYFGELKSVDAWTHGQFRLDKFLTWAGLAKVAEVNGVPPERTVEWVRRDDAEVVRLILGSLNLQGRINKVWAGDVSGYGGQSEARAALLNQLAYVSRDPAQIDRLMRQSGLDSKRMDEKRSGGTFLQYEIKRALERQKRSYDSDIAEKREAAEETKASASALKSKAATVMLPGLSIDDLRDGKGRLGNDINTASELLIRDGRLAGAICLDEFADLERKLIPFRQVFDDRCALASVGELRDDDLTSVAVWLKREWSVDVAPDRVAGVVRRWARATPINPVVDRLETLCSEWDGTPRLASWLVDYCGASASDEDSQMYLAEVGKRFLIGVVARAYVPGAQQHQMLVLQGTQGDAKSALVRTLAHVIGSDTYLEGFTLSDDKDCLLRLRGKLIGEWSELAGFGKRESEFIKEFITRGVDEYRTPYGRFMQKQPRTVSFFATTNESEFLRDPTGNRRYWPVKVGQIDIAMIRDIAGQLFGEAVQAYKAGERWWIDSASPVDARFRAICDREQRGRMVSGAYDDMALDIADRLVCNLLKRSNGLPISSTTLISVPELQVLMFPGVAVISIVGGVTTVSGVSSSEWLAAVASLKRVGWMNDKKVHGRAHWYLSEWRSAELRQLHNLCEPEPRALKKPRKVGPLSLVRISASAG